MAILSLSLQRSANYSKCTSHAAIQRYAVLANGGSHHVKAFYRPVQVLSGNKTDIMRYKNNSCAVQTGRLLYHKLEGT